MSNPYDYTYNAYDPRDWYWRAQDGRLFSSKRQAMVPEDDAKFTEWLTGAGRFVTEWPRDIGGLQTTEALNEVLQPHGLEAKV